MRHAHGHGRARAVDVALLTISDTRTLETDESGARAARMIEAGGHKLVARAIVRDEPLEIREAVDVMLRAGARVVITTGGTGISARDSTYEALAPRLEKTIPGFGELFRALSFAEIGAAAMMSRATAGTYGGGLVVILPGSPDAVRLALEKLVLPELAHLASLAEREAPRALTHVDGAGHARMVEVGDKAPTAREAVAQAVITMSGEAFAQLARGTSRKGDVLAAARLAGIQAAKRTSELIPLCHPIALSGVAVELELDEPRSRVRVVATARTTDRTGVEMEALVAANVAALTLYDMLKAVDRAMTIGDVFLLEKSGGKAAYVRAT